MDLASEFCEACQPGSPTVSDQEIEQLAPQVPEWELATVNDVPRLRRTFRFRGWEDAVAFTTAVADLATESGHHPMIRLEWGKVTVSWWTHAIRGLHRNDFIMAARTDAAYTPAAAS